MADVFSGQGSRSALARTLGEAPAEPPLIERTTIPRLLAHLATLPADRPALTYYVGGRRALRLSYRELLGRVARMHDVLRDRLGVVRGIRVATLCVNCPELIVLNLAAMAGGAIVVPLPPHESAEFLRHVIGHSEPSLLLYNRSLWPQLLASPSRSGPEVRPIEDLCPAGAGHLARTASASWDVDLPPETPAVLLYTSGTTGKPKGVTLSHYNLTVNAAALVRVHALDVRPVVPPSRREDEEAPRADVGPVHMCVLPLHHANAFGFSLVTTYYAGGHLVLNDTFPFLAARRILAKERVEICSVVPHILRNLAGRFCRAEDLPDFRYFVSAAAPLSGAVARDFVQRTGIPIRQGYGLSECTNFATTIPGDVSDDEYRAAVLESSIPSVGIPVFGCQVTVVNEAGEPVSDGVRGEVAIRGHNVMLGYWRDEEATEQALGAGHLRTGDEGFQRQIFGRTHLFLTGRLKEMIIRNGENISPRQVEAEMEPWPELEDFAVVGFAHDATGEEVGLYVRADDPDAVRESIVRRLRSVPYFKRPKVVCVSEAPVPRTSTGKVRRKEVASLFSAHREARLPDGQVTVTNGREPERDMVANWRSRDER